MSCEDRQRTDPWGNTGWADSPVVQASHLGELGSCKLHLMLSSQAAIHGDLAVLDGVHRLAKASGHFVTWCSVSKEFKSVFVQISSV